MSLEVTTEVIGVKDMLRTLNDWDKSARRKLTANFRDIMSPAMSEAKQRVPLRPLSGFDRNWTTRAGAGVQMLPWDRNLGIAEIKAGVSGKKPREYNGFTQNLTAFFLRWQGYTNTMFDMTGRRSNSTLAENLTRKWGPPSRVMWPAVNDTWPQIEDRMSRLMDVLMKETTQAISEARKVNVEGI